MQQALKISLVNLQQNNFSNHRDAFITIFKNFSLQENDIISPSNIWFFSQNQNPDSIELLNLILLKSEPPTVQNFIHNFTSTIKSLHIDIFQYKLEIEQNKTKLLKLDEVEEKLDVPNAEDELQIWDETNTITIYYYLDPKFQSEIFDHYQIKYKGSKDDQKFQTIQSEKEMFKKKKQKRKPTFVIEIDDIDQIQNINFKVLGKKISTEEFMEIAYVQLPMIQFYQMIDFDELCNRTMPKQFIDIVYEDMTIDAPYKGKNEAGFVFDISLDAEERLTIAKKTKNFYQKTNEELKLLIENNSKKIRNLMHPFQDFIGYSEDKGIYPIYSERTCTNDNCIIF